MPRTFAMNLYAVTYWVLVLAFVDILGIVFLPRLSSDADWQSVFPAIIALLVLFLLAAATATVRRPSAGRRWAWIVLSIPAVLFLLMNAPFLGFPLLHPADATFPAAITLIVGTPVLVMSGVIAYREGGRGSSGTGSRAPFVATAVAGLTVGAAATGTLAAATGGGGIVLAAPPTKNEILVARDVSYTPSTFTLTSGDVLGLYVENEDPTSHSFDIDSLAIHVQIPANATVLVPIQPTGTGTLEFYCAIPGHRAAGMVGTIDVQQGS
ncbi:MAG TPA: cupredoxin domain-containing protein [Candidatus Limnocylindrales bacterium]|nr:cupredoxin domain-containing protein [Candidatus Limnocylindrales bacterium]